MNLLSIQRALQRRVLSRTPDPLSLVHGDPNDAAERLDIYATAYRLRLQEALAANFPMLETYVAKTRFETIALEYLDAYPSSRVSVRTFGIHLPAWLRTRLHAEPWLAELAGLEWALGCAFDAVDSTVLGIESLAHIEPADWSALVFRFSAATQRLTLRTNAAALYKAVTEEQPAPTAAFAEPVEWLVWRREHQAQYRSMSSSEALALDTLLSGGTFGNACEHLLQLHPEDEVPTLAASLLKRWLLDELIIDLSVSNG